MPLTIRNHTDKSVIHENSYHAEDFNNSELTEAHKTIVQPYGEGHLSHWFFDGIRMGYSSWIYNDYVETEWKTDLDVVHLHFNLRGKITLEHKTLGKIFSLGSFQHTMFYANGFEGRIRNEELQSEIFMIQFTKAAFNRLTKDAGPWLQPFRDRIELGLPAMLSEENLFISLSLENAIRDAIGCKYDGGLKKMYLTSKCMEIMVLQSEAFRNTGNSEKKYCKTEYDKERILFARDYLVQHLDQPPGISKLARVSGINEFKLKKGFHEIFNHTIYGYLSDYRLTQAKNMVAAGEKTATEIAFELGYSSLQHFSTAFKKKFGISPSGKR
jgi:AraC family transcriptional regulator, transcriptional activator of the genes for pyochelin and ferripyochelin receptors